VDFDTRVPLDAGANDAQTLATELHQRNIDNVYMLVSPFFWIQVAEDAANQGYKPKWVGIQSVDQIARAGCSNSNSIQGALFLNFTPAWIDRNKYDPDFDKAAGGGSSDIVWDLWGLERGVAQMLRQPGRNLTRERFVYFNERAGAMTTGVLPPFRFTPGNHFGGRSMHLLKADCSSGRWVTAKAFVSHF
jgi:hypothetical protein